MTLEQLEGDPHALLARLREREPVSWVPALQGWLVTRRDLAMRVMRDPQTFTVDDSRFSTGQVVGPSMLTRDGAEQRRHCDQHVLSARRSCARPGCRRWAQGLFEAPRLRRARVRRPAALRGSRSHGLTGFDDRR